MKINNQKIEKIKLLENKLNNYTVYLNKKGYAWPGIGYFFDKNDSKWKIFDTHEKGELTYSHIAETEDEVIDKLLKVLEVEYDAQQVIIKLRKRNSLSER